jgi:hypothetical protein
MFLSSQGTRRSCNIIHATVRAVASQGLADIARRTEPSLWPHTAASP